MDLYLEYYPDSAQKIEIRKKIEVFFLLEKKLARSNAIEFVKKLNQELKKENDLLQFHYQHTSGLTLYLPEKHFSLAADYDSLDKINKIYSKKWIKNYEIKNGRSKFPYTSEFYNKGFFSFLKRKSKYPNHSVYTEKIQKAAIISQNYGIANQEIQEGNIRYLKLTEWLFDKDVEKTKSLINFIKDGNALILDLRNVKYGNIESIATLLHVFSQENNTKTISFGNYYTAQNQIIPITLPTKENAGKQGKRFSKAIKKLSKIDANLPIYILTDNNTAGLTNFFIHSLQKMRPKTVFIIGQPTSKDWQLTKECNIYLTMPFTVPYATLKNSNQNSKNEEFNYSILPHFYSTNPKQTAFLKAFQNFKDEYKYQESVEIMDYVQTYFEADKIKLNDSTISIDFLKNYTGKYEHEKTVLIDKETQSLVLIHYEDTIFLKQISENTFMPMDFYKNKQATKNEFLYMNMNVQPVFYNFSRNRTNDKNKEAKNNSYKMNIKYSDKSRISYDFEEKTENPFFEKNRNFANKSQLKINQNDSIFSSKDIQVERENLDSLRQIFAKLDFEERTRLFKTYTLNNPLQDFEIETITGNKFKLSELEGKIVVINYWFIGCVPCLKEIPELNKLVEEYADKGVIFLAISRMDTKEQIEKFVQKKPFYYDIMADSKVLTENHFIPIFPTNIIIDTNGTVVFGEIGYKETIYQQIKTALDRLIVE